MIDYTSIIADLKDILPFLNGENFEAARDGTHYKVYLSNKYAIRFREDNPALLIRETDFLRQLNHPLIPKIIWQGHIKGSTLMVENRLLGKTINTNWNIMDVANQANIIKQIIDFIFYLKSEKRESYYSVSNGKKYKTYFDLLMDNFEEKIAEINKITQTQKFLKKIMLILNNLKLRSLFKIEKNITLVHGDLIIHNLLTDSNNLTGVLDWELGQYGDPDYDLFRLFYYEECAKAYMQNGVDESFEADFMKKLIEAILKAKIIEDISLFKNKYQFVRAIYFLNAFTWAVRSSDPMNNIIELEERW